MGMVLVLLFWVGLVAFALWLVRALFPNASQPPASAAGKDLTALQILDRRFARGEISREEYELMRETLHEWVA